MADELTGKQGLQKENATLYKLSEISRELVGAHDLTHLLHQITQAAREITDSDSATIFLYEPKANQLYFKVALGEKGEEVKKYLLAVDESSIAGWIAYHRKSQIIEDAGIDPRHYKKIDQEVGYQTKSVLGVPMIYQTELLGVLEAVNKKSGKFDRNDENFLQLLADQAAIAIKNAQLIEDLRNFFVNGIELLITALECPAPTGHGHAFRVARTATGMARILGIKGKAYENIYYASLLHDIGLLKLNTGSPVDLRYHPMLGAELVSRIRLLEEIAPIIRYHHERLDGSGFPEALRGDEIPLEAQILGLAELLEEEFADEQLAGQDFANFLDRNAGKFQSSVLNALKDTYLPLGRG